MHTLCSLQGCLDDRRDVGSLELHKWPGHIEQLNHGCLDAFDAHDEGALARSIGVDGHDVACIAQHLGGLGGARLESASGFAVLYRGSLYGRGSSTGEAGGHLRGRRSLLNSTAPSKRVQDLLLLVRH